MKLAIFGDSYISRLQKFTSNNMDLPGECRFFGVPGMTTRRKFDDAFARVLQYQPTFLFLCLGGNDIDATTKPLDLVKRLMSVVAELKAVGVRRVFVASIVARGRVRKGTVSRFNRKRKSVNKKLSARLGNDFVDLMKRLKFPRHYDGDLVHPGRTEGGMKIFRMIIHRCMSSACRLP